MRENTEKWMGFCELASKEQDPKKLMELTGEIVRLLDAKGHPQVAADEKRQ